MTAHPFKKKEIRLLLLENGFAIRLLTYWTTLLFPLAVVARTLGGSATGSDLILPRTNPSFFSRAMTLFEHRRCRQHRRWRPDRLAANNCSAR
jgi:hypothetical protein